MDTFRTGAHRRTFRRAAPARCGAFADERRIVAGDEGGRVRHRRACASLVASFAAGVREAGARTDNALFTPACSSPPSVALRPRVAARSPMSGASLPATRRTSATRNARPVRRAVRFSKQRGRAGFGVRASVGRGPPTGRGSRRSIRFARLELERITPLHAGALIATFRCAAPARCGAFADERRIVAATKAAECGRETLIQSRRAAAPRTRAAFEARAGVRFYAQNPTAGRTSRGI